MRSIDDAESADRALLESLDNPADIAQFVIDRWDVDEVCLQLDELVHEGKAHEAAAINNQGIEAQVQYLAHPYAPGFAKDLANLLYGEKAD